MTREDSARFGSPAYTVVLHQDLAAEHIGRIKERDRGLITDHRDVRCRRRVAIVEPRPRRSGMPSVRNVPAWRPASGPDTRPAPSAARRLADRGHHQAGEAARAVPRPPQPLRRRADAPAVGSTRRRFWPPRSDRSAGYRSPPRGSPADRLDAAIEGRAGADLRDTQAGDHDQDDGHRDLHGDQIPASAPAWRRRAEAVGGDDAAQVGARGVEGGTQAGDQQRQSSGGHRRARARDVELGLQPQRDPAVEHEFGAEDGHRGPGDEQRQRAARRRQHHCFRQSLANQPPSRRPKRRRIADSCRRPATRASIRFARFVHATSSTRSTAVISAAVSGPSTWPVPSGLGMLVSGVADHGVGGRPRLLRLDRRSSSSGCAGVDSRAKIRDLGPRVLDRSAGP